VIENRVVSITGAPERQESDSDRVFFRGMPGSFGAGLRVGRAFDGGLLGGGDSMLLDFRHGFFAVADSSERSPRASESLLTRIYEMMSRFFGVQKQNVLAEFDLARLYVEIKLRTEKILRETSPLDSTSLTGFLVLQTPTEPRGMILHTGDSLLMKFNKDAGIEQISETNFWMVGRSAQLYQMATVEIGADDMFLLATDGIADLPVWGNRYWKTALPQILVGTPIDEVPEQMMRKRSVQKNCVDDSTILTLSPPRLPRTLDTTIVTRDGIRSLS